MSTPSSVPATILDSGLTPADFARAAAQEATSRGLRATADRFLAEAHYFDAANHRPGPSFASYELMPDGSAPVRLSFQIKVY